jgi:ParB-like chromosome segregation protein Spo0J
MDPGKNKITTLRIKNIEKNRLLPLGASRSDVSSKEKLVRKYGVLTLPVVVRNEENHGYFKVICDQESLEAGENAGMKEIPVIEVETAGAVEEYFIALGFSVSQDKNPASAICEGNIILKLIEAGQSRREIGSSINKSKSWVSKREKLAKSLQDILKQKVVSGDLCPVKAISIAKLPEDVQVVFGMNVIKAGLSQRVVDKAVSDYLDPKTDDLIRKAIIDDPAGFYASTEFDKTNKNKKNKVVKGRQDPVITYDYIIRVLERAKVKIGAAEVNALIREEKAIDTLEVKARDFLGAIKIAKSRINNHTADQKPHLNS